MKKHILFLPLILLFTSCANKDRNLTSSDVIGCRMLELQGNTFFITAPIGALVQKTGNLFKDEEEQRDLKAVCDDVRYGKYVDEAIAKEKVQKENQEKEQNLEQELEVKNK